MVWSGEVWGGVRWSGVMWSGVEWGGVMWCGVVCVVEGLCGVVRVLWVDGCVHAFVCQHAVCLHVHQAV